jgi:hypothetical protein
VGTNIHAGWLKDQSKRHPHEFVYVQLLGGTLARCRCCGYIW